MGIGKIVTEYKLDAENTLSEPSVKIHWLLKNKQNQADESQSIA